MGSQVTLIVVKDQLGLASAAALRLHLCSLLGANPSHWLGHGVMVDKTTAQAIRRKTDTKADDQ